MLHNNDDNKQKVLNDMLNEVTYSWKGESGSQSPLVQQFFGELTEYSDDQLRIINTVIVNVLPMFDKQWILELDETQKKNVARTLLSEEFYKYFIRGMQIY